MRGKLLLAVTCLAAGVAVSSLADNPLVRRQARLRRTAVTAQPTTMSALKKARAERSMARAFQYTYRDTVADVPYIENFQPIEQTSYFTFIDANGDGSTWAPGYTSNGGSPCLAYKWNSTNAADDWAISPDIRMRKGMHYLVTFKVACQGSAFHEKIEAKWGQGKTVAAMTNDLVGVTEVKSWNKVQLEKEITVAEDGLYNIGFHAVSDKDKGQLYVDDIIVSELMPSEAPARVADLKATPDPAGALKATITMTAPSTDADGNAISKIDYIQVRNGMRTVKEVQNPAPGSTVTVVDENAEQGVNEYTAAAFLDDNKGEDVTISQYVGLDQPKTLGNVCAIDKQTQVTLTWDAVDAVGVNGGIANPGDVTYEIYNVADGTLGDQIGTTQSTSYTFDYATTTGEQDIAQWAVRAANSYTSGIAVAASVITGESYKLPFAYSCADGDPDYLWWLDAYGDSDVWGFSSSKSADGDGGSAVVAVSAGDNSSLLSGKISLAGATKPALRFEYMAPNAGTTLTVYALLADGTSHDLKTFSGTDGDKAWHKVSVSLADYVSADYVIFGLRAQAADDSKGGYVWADNFSVDDQRGKDIAVKLTAPAKARKGKAVDCTLKVENLGAATASGYSVALYKDGKQISTFAPDGELEVLGTVTTTVSVPTNSLDGDDIELRAKLAYDGDENASNDEAEATTKFADRALFAPQNVVVTNGKATWVAPSVKSYATADGFEDYNTWTNSFGDWTVVNGNGGLASGLIHDTPYPNQGTPVGMQVFNFDEVVSGLTNDNEYVRAHGGQQFVGSPLVTDEDGNFTAVDNWLISPHLTGKAQTVTFYANNLRGAKDELTGTWDNYPEHVEVLASSTGRDVADFTVVKEAFWVNSGAWTSYSVSLPAGTKYFAVHHMSDDRHAVLLFLDDFSFDRSVGAPTAYNIYSGDKLLGTVDGSTKTFDVSSVSAIGDETVRVSAVYDEGDESDAIVATVIATGIDGVSADGEAARNGVYTIDGVRYDKVPGTPGLYIINGKKMLKK